MKYHYPLPCRRRRCRWCDRMGKPWMCPYPRRLSRYQIERREVRYRRYRRILLRRALLDLLWRRDL